MESGTCTQGRRWQGLFEEAQKAHLDQSMKGNLDFYHSKSKIKWLELHVRSVKDLIS